ncbi:hypothetical protein VQ574_20740 (plasmid) [Stutzerimonas frequens]|uniref:hypothetical protein n=1 Tax=Stutzerimonas frequens TaxID=2968969 RepID=UPI002DBB0293|nr:hypothetical protein [Stutzerimonas frequens]WRW29367.1 hypothetical protein VQ574_20740 [Stutzerimonas frequens]
MTTSTPVGVIVHIQPRVRPTQALANALIEQLVLSGAENYQEDHFDFTIDGEDRERPVVVTIAFGDRPSPHTLRMQAEGERDEIAAQAERREASWRALAEKLISKLVKSNDEETKELVREARRMLGRRKREGAPASNLPSAETT